LFEHVLLTLAAGLSVKTIEPVNQSAKRAISVLIQVTQNTGQQYGMRYHVQGQFKDEQAANLIPAMPRNE